MADDDWEVFREMRTEKQRKRNTRALAFDEAGWNYFVRHSHYYMQLPGGRVDHWPSSNKWLYQGKYYRGSAPKAFLGMIETQRQENIRNGKQEPVQGS